VALLGFFREASSLLHEFQREHSRDFLHGVMVVDFNPEIHEKLKEQGIRVEYGDISNVETLRHLHLDQARLLVCTVPDHLLKGINNLQLLRNLKGMAPQARIVVTAETLDSARAMYAEGAAYVFVPRVVASHYLAEILDRILADSAGNLAQKAGDYLSKRHEVLP
jgi:voltage-gated potassium channel Kch